MGKHDKDIAHLLGKLTVALDGLPPAPPERAGYAPVVFNIPMASADTEYRYELPVGTKTFVVHCRDGTAFRLSYERERVANSNPPYFTVKDNNSYSEWNLNLSKGVFLYVACASASKVVEGVAWR